MRKARERFISKNGKVESTFVTPRWREHPRRRILSNRTERGAAYKVDENGNDAYRLWYASGKNCG